MGKFLDFLLGTLVVLGIGNFMVATAGEGFGARAYLVGSIFFGSAATNTQLHHHTHRRK